jgi:sugar phosphate isomerase/epimerase
MLRFGGHTMGVPGMEVVEAMRFFADLGFEGIEIRCGDQATIEPKDFGPDLAARINAARRGTGIEVACLTPYFRQFHVPAEREAEMAGMRATVEMAARIGCPVVRAFAGKNPPMAGPEHAAARAAWIDAMRDLGRFAAPHGVAFAIETHDGTLVPSLKEAVHLAEDIALPNVGLLVDYANAYPFGPHGRAAVALVAPYVKHVHMKDILTDHGGAHQFVDFGQGNIDWPEVLDALDEVGFAGFVSDEYEKCWHPELPPAEVAMKQHVTWLRAWRDKRAKR